MKSAPPLFGSHEPHPDKGIGIECLMAVLISRPICLGAAHFFGIHHELPRTEKWWQKLMSHEQRLGEVVEQWRQVKVVEQRPGKAVEQRLGEVVEQWRLVKVVELILS